MSAPQPAPRDASALAESVAHELNNIGASLFGFVELAAEAASGRDGEAAWLGEIRVGVQRIAALAALLEALAGTRGEPVATTLSECLKDGAAAGDYRLDWRCDAATRVVADAEHVRRAAKILVRTAPVATQTEPSALVVAQLADDASCLTCGAPLRAGDVYMDGQVAIDRAAAAPGKPTRRAETALRRLVNDASSHAAHLAGGHVCALFGDGTPALVLRAVAAHSSTSRGK